MGGVPDIAYAVVGIFEAPLFLGTRMTNGVTVSTRQIEVYLGAGRFPRLVYAESYLNTNIIRRKFSTSRLRRPI